MSVKAIARLNFEVVAGGYVSADVRDNLKVHRTDHGMHYFLYDRTNAEALSALSAILCGVVADAPLQ